MQLLAVVIAALATSQTLAFSTNGNEDKIFLLEDANIYPSNAPPGYAPPGDAPPGYAPPGDASPGYIPAYGINSNGDECIIQQYPYCKGVCTSRSS